MILLLSLLLKSLNKNYLFFKNRILLSKKQRENKKWFKILTVPVTYRGPDLHSFFPRIKEQHLPPPQSNLIHLPLRSLFVIRSVAFSDCSRRFFSRSRTSSGLDAASYRESRTRSQSGDAGKTLRRVVERPTVGWGWNSRMRCLNSSENVREISSLRHSIAMVFDADHFISPWDVFLSAPLIFFLKKEKQTPVCLSTHCLSWHIFLKTLFQRYRKNGQIKSAAKADPFPFPYMQLSIIETYWK